MKKERVPRKLKKKKAKFLKKYLTLWERHKGDISDILDDGNGLKNALNNRSWTLEQK